MVRHIVLFRMKANDQAQRASDIAAMKQRLEALRDVVPGVERLDVAADLGEVAGHWEAALVSEHPDAAALAGYQGNPAHREVVEWLNTIVADRAVVDYELS
jgi:hypothetical protein